MGKNGDNIKIDRISFQLGMINCFVEMVACGVKKLSISPPVFPHDYNKIAKYSEKIVNAFGIQSYLEKSLLITDLQTEEFTKEKWSILYYEDDGILNAYKALKDKKEELERSGRYDVHARKEISGEFMRLLSYPDDKINERLSKDRPESPYMLI